MYSLFSLSTLPLPRQKSWHFLPNSPTFRSIVGHPPCLVIYYTAYRNGLARHTCDRYYKVLFILFYIATGLVPLDLHFDVANKTPSNTLFHTMFDEKSGS
jgi:hypothetical protein